jgi:demethoxyubiquinone hydroxylase (CLK1/Coq7/Cat5 family)/predicted DCC family thiol-disulfide oxidoreductase YuxK
MISYTVRFVASCRIKVGNLLVHRGLTTALMDQMISEDFDADKIKAAKDELYASFKLDLPMDRLDRARIMRDLCSNHAGEYGAVHIYIGMKAAIDMRMSVSSSPEYEKLREFAIQHYHTESRHLAYYDTVLASNTKCAILPLWRAAGFTLGWLPSVISPTFGYRTIQFVEQFVVDHYNEQFATLRKHCPLNYHFAKEFCDDEAHHRDDANNKAVASLSKSPSSAHTPISATMKLWSWVVRQGSIHAVHVSKLTMGGLRSPNSFETQSVVYFDGSCGLCSKEIAHYQKLDSSRSDRKFLWLNVATASDDDLLKHGLQRDEAMAVMHVRNGRTGEMETGINAFAAMWARLPYFWPLLSLLVRLPVVSHVLQAAYLYWAKHRHKISTNIMRVIDPKAQEAERAEGVARCQLQSNLAKSLAYCDQW